MIRLLTVLLVLFFVGPVMAGNFWLEATWGYSEYGMTDLPNYPIPSRWDAVLVLEPGSLDSGQSYGLSFGFGLGRNWDLGFSYDRILADSKTVPGSMPADLDLPVHAFYLEPRFYFIRNGFFRLRGACALGLGHLSGFVYTHDVLSSYNGAISEVDLYLGASVSGEVWPLEAFGLFGTFGVRDLSFEPVAGEYRVFASEEYGGALPKWECIW